MSEWLPASAAVPDGTLCDLMFRDALGAYVVPGPYFLRDDGHWYWVDPPRQLNRPPIKFRPGSFPVPVGGHAETPHPDLPSPLPKEA